ncbi:BQ5605_C001g00725 [Microbotryum silenes-dioicae]|uniref:BQ5605_C001g00725 protein n=1 Tax=Microbotryum silenes-dioicae TaxID=796604 RepID=A0A2X0P6R9_9BASI|nr:BQ5605_C001g00725 [Microbotryum silenes-dioicae]
MQNRTENPYTTMMVSLDALVYRTPSPGFRTRMIVMVAINVLWVRDCTRHSRYRHFFFLLTHLNDGPCRLIISSFVYLGMSQYERRAKARSAAGPYRTKERAFWLFRRVERPSGKVLIPNHRTVGVFFIILAEICSMGFGLDAIETYVYHRSMSHILGWISFSLAPMFEHGWILVWSNFTTFLLTTDKYSGIKVSSRLVNVFFISVFVIGSVLGIVAGSVHTYKGSKFWESYTQLMTLLKSDAAAYLNVPALNYELAQLHLARTHCLYNEFWKAGTYTWGPNIMSALAVLVVNFFGLFLCRTLNRQVEFQKAQLFSSVAIGSVRGVMEATSGNINSKSTASRATWRERLSSLFGGNTRSRDGGRSSKVSFSEIRRMSKAPGRSHYKDKARTIVILSRARTELLLALAYLSQFSLAAGFIAIVVVATLMHLTVTSSTLTIAYGPWWIFESAAFIGTWSYPALLLLILNALTYQSFREIGPTRCKWLGFVNGNDASANTVETVIAAPTTRESDEWTVEPDLNHEEKQEPAVAPGNFIRTRRKLGATFARIFGAGKNLEPKLDRSNGPCQPRVLEINLAIDRVIKEESEDRTFDV